MITPRWSFDIRPTWEAYRKEIRRLAAACRVLNCHLAVLCGFRIVPTPAEQRRHRERVVRNWRQRRTP